MDIFRPITQTKFEREEGWAFLQPMINSALCTANRAHRLPCKALLTCEDELHPRKHQISGNEDNDIWKCLLTRNDAPEQPAVKLSPLLAGYSRWGLVSMNNYPIGQPRSNQEWGFDRKTRVRPGRTVESMRSEEAGARKANEDPSLLALNYAESRHRYRG